MLAESTKEIMIAAEVRDVEWSSFTCVQGWPVQGIGPKFQGATGINTSSRSSFGDTIATGDDWGVVKLFRCVLYLVRASFNLSDPSSVCAAFVL